MSLRFKRMILSRINDEVFISNNLAHALPKYRLPAKETSARYAYLPVHDEPTLDSQAR